MITPKISSSLVQKAQSWISAAERIVILTHISPDGDAMGSSLGMRHYLESLGKSVSVIVPNNPPSFLHWMPSAILSLQYDNQATKADGFLDTADMIICTDFNEPKRIGTLGDRMMTRVMAGVPTLVIDHHLIAEEKTVPAMDNVLTIIDHTSPSASELVYRLIHQMGGAINLNAATCLYTGMMTDTGNFSFNSNYPEMYEIVGDLVRLGVNKDKVYDAVFNAYSADRMRLMGYCLYEKMRIFPERHAALIALSTEELAQFHFHSGDAEGLVNLPLQIKDVYYSCFMREDKVNPTEQTLAEGASTKVKISMRSQGDRPVNTFCHDIFNGGGHMNASGGEHYGVLSDAIQLFLDNYPNYFHED